MPAAMSAAPASGCLLKRATPPRYNTTGWSSHPKPDELFVNAACQPAVPLEPRLADAGAAVKRWRNKFGTRAGQPARTYLTPLIAGHTGDIIQLERILQSQGFGSRKQCRTLIEAGRASRWAISDDAAGQICYRRPAVQRRRRGSGSFAPGLPVAAQTTGHECSRNPQHHPSVLSLLPAPWLRERGVQCVGRLDEDTQRPAVADRRRPLAARLTHPKRHVPKRYAVRYQTCRHRGDAAGAAARRAAAWRGAAGTCRRTGL